MNGIDELISPQGPNESAFNAIVAAKVHSVSDSQVSVTIDGFPPDQIYATVPTVGGTPSSGDNVILLHNSDGNPIVALVP
jgi:hypothetical protein